MRLAELDIDVEQLQRVIDRPAVQRAAPGDASVRRRGRGGTYVTEEVLAAVLGDEPACKCEELGLHAGMHVNDLAALGPGCTGVGVKVGDHELRPGTAWVCHALDTIRRRYGL